MPTLQHTFAKTALIDDEVPDEVAMLLLAVPPAVNANFCPFFLRNSLLSACYLLKTRFSIDPLHRHFPLGNINAMSESCTNTIPRRKNRGEKPPKDSSTRVAKERAALLDQGSNLIWKLL